MLGRLNAPFGQLGLYSISANYELWKRPGVMRVNTDCQMSAQHSTGKGRRHRIQAKTATKVDPGKSAARPTTPSSVHTTQSNLACPTPRDCFVESACPGLGQTHTAYRMRGLSPSRACRRLIVFEFPERQFTTAVAVMIVRALEWPCTMYSTVDGRLRAWTSWRCT